MVPYPYNKPQIDLLYQLIAESNPGAAYPLIPENAVIGKPEAIAVVPGTIANTRIPISGRGPYIASSRVNYRRIDLTQFFKGITVSFESWSSYGASYIDAPMIVAYMNKTYGLSLTVNDFVSPAGLWLAGPNSTNIAATSLCYTGSIPWTWKQGKREISAVLVTPDLGGRQFPGGNVFDELRKPSGEYVCFDLSFDPVKDAIIQSATTSVAWPAPGGWSDPIFPFLQANVSPLFDKGKPHTEVGGLVGAPYIHVALPTALGPDANIGKYNRAILVTALPNSWWQGKIMFQYKA